MSVNIIINKINKTELKKDHLKCVHINKEVPT